MICLFFIKSSHPTATPLNLPALHSPRSECTVNLFFLPRWCFRNAGLDVDSGERRVISSVALEAEDLDTPPRQVYYVVNAAPRFGELQLQVSLSRWRWRSQGGGQTFTLDPDNEIIQII